MSNRPECLLDNYIMKQLIIEKDVPFLPLLDVMRESGKCDDLVKKIYQELGMEMPQSKNYLLCSFSQYFNKVQ